MLFFSDFPEPNIVIFWFLTPWTPTNIWFVKQHIFQKIKMLEENLRIKKSQEKKNIRENEEVRKDLMY